MNIRLSNILKTFSYISVAISIVLIFAMIFRGSLYTSLHYKYSSIESFFYNNYIYKFNFTSLLFIPIITIILTPLARVVLSIFEYIYEKNTKFVFITLIVFFLLMISLFLIS